jgi:hypothetical protein
MAENTAPTPTCFAEIVSDYFPILHTGQFCLFCSLPGNDKVILNSRNATGEQPGIAIAEI